MKNTKKIVIIDDDRLYLEVLKNDLYTLENVEINTYNSAEEYFNIDREQPDLVILDYYLDSLNENYISGYQALKKFKEQKDSPNVILISGNFNEDLLTGLYYENYNRKSIDFIDKDFSNSKRLVNKAKTFLNS